MSGQCIHCLLPLIEESKGSVFPKSWYAKKTPGDILRWFVPSCGACNAAHEALEEELKLRLGFCLAPFDPATQAIAEDVAHALDPKHAVDMKDMVERSDTRKRIAKEKENPVDLETIRQLGKKIVKGICCVLKDGAIVLEDNIKIYEDQDAQKFEALLKQSQSHKGPGILALTASSKEQPNTLLAKITIWNQYNVRASAHFQNNTIE